MSWRPGHAAAQRTVSGRFPAACWAPSFRGCMPAYTSHSSTGLPAGTHRIMRWRENLASVLESSSSTHPGCTHTIRDGVCGKQCSAVWMSRRVGGYLLGCQEQTKQPWLQPGTIAIMSTGPRGCPPAAPAQTDPAAPPPQDPAAHPPPPGRPGRGWLPCCTPGLQWVEEEGSRWSGGERCEQCVMLLAISQGRGQMCKRCKHSPQPLPTLTRRTKVQVAGAPRPDDLVVVPVLRQQRAAGGHSGAQQQQRGCVRSSGDGGSGAAPRRQLHPQASAGRPPAAGGPGRVHLYRCQKQLVAMNLRLPSAPNSTADLTG